MNGTLLTFRYRRADGEEARLRHTYILSGPQFHALLATGELPDEEDADALAF